MPRSKNYNTYPEAYRDFVREAAVRPITVQCDSVDEAKKLSGKMYSFHGALKRAIKEPDTPEDIRVLQKMSEKVQYRVEGDRLIARPQDMDPTAKLLLKSMGTTEAPTSADAMRPSAEFLEALKKGGDDE